MLIREALAQGGADLKFAGIKTPGLDASLLLSHVLKRSRTELLASSVDTISDDASVEYCSLIERRCFGECAAYLTGKKEFRGLEFNVNNTVLVPRPDTETLVDAALETLSSDLSGISKNKNKTCIKVLDLCTGCGAVAVALKNELSDIEVHAADISAKALDTAKENAERLLGENKVAFYRGDLFAALPEPRSQFSFSLIVSNPPYIPSEKIKTLSAEVRNEPRIALDGGKSGLEIIKRITEEAPDFLRHNGALLMEADPRQMDEIKALLEKKGFKDIKTYNDLSSLKRVIGGRYEK